MPKVLRALGALSLAAAASAGIAGVPGLGDPPNAHAAVPVVVLEGKGWGHGVGLPQHGARYLADAGRNAGEILGTFYPGTALGQGAAATVRVAVHTAPDGETLLQFPQGGEVRSAPEGPQAPGFPVRVGPGGQVAVQFDGSYQVSPVMTAQSQPAAVRRHSLSGDVGAAEEDCVPLLGPCPSEPPPEECVVGCPESPPSTPPPTSPPDSKPPPSEEPPPEQTTTTAPPPNSNSGPARSDKPVWAVPADGSVTLVPARERSYRSLLQAVAGEGGLRLVNHVDVETYLRGLGEMPSSWPLAALEAQTIAARTYALRTMSFGGELCDYEKCQVYIGATREAGRQDQAVANTRGMVVTFGGELASTVYSADAGGVSANTREGFGTPENIYPYLTNVRYDTPNPLPWQLEIALSDVAGRLQYPGDLTAVRVAETGPSGRALAVDLDGAAGPKRIDGLSFAQALGLRSTLFTARTGISDSAPSAPPPADPALLQQALPEDTQALADAAKTGDKRRGLAEDRAEAVLPKKSSSAAALGDDVVRRTLLRLIIVAGMAAIMVSARLKKLNAALSNRMGS